MITNSSNECSITSFGRNSNSTTTHLKWKHQQSEEDPLLQDKERYYEHNNGSAVIKIDVPTPIRDEPRFPKEKWKTFVAFVVLVGNFIITTVSLAIVHDRLPDRDVYGPLPDIVLDNLESRDWALDISEIQIMVVVYSSMILILFHKHKFIVMRRIFLVISLLYFMRSITMFVTVLPVPSKTYFCSPKSNLTSTLLVAKRSIKLLTGFGLSINGNHTFCGDYIYSGHTVMLVLGYLVIKEYSPKRFYILHWLTWLNALVGVFFILLSHGHYTIDVIIAYYVTTRLFWTFHTLVNQNILIKPTPQNYNYIAREWWVPILRYFEKNVRGPLPRQFEWPFSWSRCSTYTNFSVRES